MTGTTILLVEHDPADAHFAERLLPATYTCIQAANLAEALDCIKDRRIDAVLLDLNLPDSSRSDTIAYMVSQLNKLPIVVLTGIEDVASAVQALRLGAHDYLVKAELNAEKLVHTIEQAIEAQKLQRAEQSLLEITRLSELTSDVGQSLVQGITLPAMLAGCTEAIVMHLDASFARIWTLDALHSSLLLQAKSGRYPHLHADCDTLSLAESGLGLIALQKQLRHCTIGEEDLGVCDMQWAKREGLVTFVGQPLLVADRLVGMLEFFTRQAITAPALSALGTVADQIALGIEHNTAEAARALLATIVEHSEAGIISKDLNGTILSWNLGAANIYGYTSEEMIGQNISVIMENGSIDEFLSIIEQLKNGQQIGHYETTCIRKDGDKITVALSISSMKDSSGNITGASAIVSDITKRKRSESITFAQNEVTRILSQGDSISRAARDILLRIATASQFEFAALWCLDRADDVIRCVDVWHGVDPSLSELEALTKDLTFPSGTSLPGRILASGKPCWISDLAKDDNFTRLPAAVIGGLCSAVGFPILIGTKVLGVVEFFSRKHREPDDELFTTMENIGAQIGQAMDREHAESSAKLSAEAQLKMGQAIMQNAPIGIAWLDSDLVIAEANNAFARQFGLERKDLPGTYMFEIPTGIPNDCLVEVISEGLPFSANNFQIKLSDAQRQRDAFCDLTVWPVKDANDKPVGLVVLIIEVTERVKLSKQREDFVATLTHDLKNPLIGQDRILEMFLEGNLGPLEGEQKNILNLLKTGTHELLDLIGTLLEVYRYEDGAPQLRYEQIQPDQLINGCIAQVMPIAQKKGVEIKSTHEEEPEAFFADQMALRRVVMNLLDNAVKFTPSGGRIDVSSSLKKSGLTITVADSGTGITLREQQSLFQRFSQTASGKFYKASTGLGLYLCRQIVEGHGGKITCTSQEGSGAKFVATLPIGS